MLEGYSQDVGGNIYGMLGKMLEGYLRDIRGNIGGMYVDYFQDSA